MDTQITGNEAKVRFETKALMTIQAGVRKHRDTLDMNSLLPELRSALTRVRGGANHGD